MNSCSSPLVFFAGNLRFQLTGVRYQHVVFHLEVTCCSLCTESQYETLLQTLHHVEACKKLVRVTR